MYRICKYVGIAATDLVLYVSNDDSTASCKSGSSAHAGSCRRGINDIHSIQIQTNLNKLYVPLLLLLDLCYIYCL